MKHLAKRAIASFMAALIGFQPVLLHASEIIKNQPDNGPRPHLDQSYNGTDVLNIARPNGHGVSHDIYDKFSADDLIINNSAVNVSTQLGGWVEGNPNFKRGDAARLWIGEVVGGSASQLNGILEVAGRSLDIVLANEHGITCNGCGFINTGRATLSTGIPRFSETGDFKGLDVRQGQVTIGERGLNPEDRVALSNTSRVDVIARAAAVYGKMRAQNLNVVAGANLVDYNWSYDAATGEVKGVKPQAGQGDAPALAVDVAALGGMYANAIQMIATEKGVGVRIDGTMASGTNINLDASGRLTIGGNHGGAAPADKPTAEIVKAKQKITIRAQGPILLEGAIASEDNDSVKIVSKDTLTAAHQISGGAVVLESAGETVISSIVKGRDSLSVRSFTDDITITDNAALSATNIAINANQNLTVDGQVKAGETLSLVGSTSVATGTKAELLAADIAVSGTTVSLAGRIDAQRKFTGLSSDTFANNGELTAGNLSISSVRDFNNSGTIVARDTAAVNTTNKLGNSGTIAANALTLTSDNLVSNSGKLAADQQLVINAAKRLQTAQGSELSAGTIRLSSQELQLSGAASAHNLLKIIAGQGGVSSDADMLADEVSVISQGIIANQGTVDARSSLNFTANSTLTNSGQLHTLGALTLASDAAINIAASGKTFGNTVTLTGPLISNAGTAVAKATAQFQAGQHGIENAGVIVGQNIILDSAAHILSLGSIASSNEAKLTAQTQITTLAGSVLRGHSLVIKANALSLASTTAATGAVHIIAGTGGLDQKGTLSGKTVTLNASSDIRNSGIISAGDVLSVETNAAITNAATMISGKDIKIFAPQLINNGGVIWANDAITFAADSQLERAKLLQNTNGRIEAFQGNLTIRADEVHNLGTAPSISVSQIIKWTEKGRSEPINPTEQIIKLVDPSYLGADGKILPQYASAYAALWADVVRGGKALSAESRSILKASVVTGSGTRLADDFITLWTDMYAKANAAGTPDPADSMRLLIKPEMFDASGKILPQYAGSYAALWDLLASGGTDVSDDMKAIIATSALVVLETKTDPVTGAVTLVYSNKLKDEPAAMWRAMKAGAGAYYDIIKILYQDRFNSDGKLAELVAGGDIDIAAEKLYNIYGNISAKRNIRITADQIKNQALGASQVLVEVHKKPGCFTCHEGKVDFYDTFGGRIEANGQVSIAGNLQNITEQTSDLSTNDVLQKLNQYIAERKAEGDFKDVPFASWKNLELKDRRQDNYTAPVEGNGKEIRKVEGKDTGSETHVDTGTDPKVNKPDENITTIPVETGKISDKLKPVSPVTPQLDPSASVDALLAAGLNTLTETNPEFTEYANFITSNYMMAQDRLAYRDDLVNNTKDPILKALDEGKSRLPSDPDTSYLDKPVQVPLPDGSGTRTVYPAQKPLELNTGGALIKGDTVAISGGTLETKGTIEARGNVSVTSNKITGTGGRIASTEGNISLTSAGGVSLENMAIDGRSVDIVAGQDFVGKGISVTARDNASIFAATGVIMTALEKEMSGRWGKNTNYKTIDQFTSSLNVGGDLSIVTLGDLALLGVDGEAGGKINLSASGDLVLATVATKTESHTKTKKTRMDVAEVTSHVTSLKAGGDVTAVAGGQALLVGTEIDSGGKVKLAAEKDVTLAAAQDIYDYFYEKKSGNWFRKKLVRDTITEVVNKGVQIGARGDIDILATSGNLITAGSSFVSSEGNVDLTAKKGNIYAGAYTDIYQESHLRKKTYLGGLFGSTKSESIENRFSTGTKALAELDLTLVSGGDTTLIGTQLKAGGNLSVNTGGDFSVQAAINSMRRDYFSQKLGAITMTTITEQSFKEVALLTQIMAGGKLDFSIGGKAELTLYNYAGVDPEDLKNLYPEELLTIAGLKFLEHQLADEYFYDKQVQLSPAFKAVVAIAVGNFVAPFIVGAIAPSLSGAMLTAAKAFTSSFIVESLDGIVSGNYDLGKILAGASFKGLTAGLTSLINIENYITIGDGSFLKEALLPGIGEGKLTLLALLDGALDGVITSGLGSIINGTDFGSSFSASMINTLVSLALADVQNGIGGLKFEEGSVQHMLLHGLAGCAAAAAQKGSCAAGAAGGIAQSLYAGYLEKYGSIDKVKALERMEFYGSLAGFIFSEGKDENVSIAGQIAKSALKNNYLSHAQILSFDEELKACGNDTNCKEAVRYKYLELTIINDAALRACETEECLLAHQAIIEEAKELYQTILNPYTKFDPAFVKALYDWQTPNQISRSVEEARQWQLALEEGRESCNNDESCVRTYAQDRFETWQATQEFKYALGGAAIATAFAKIFRGKVWGGSTGNTIPNNWQRINGVGSQINTPRGFTSYKTPDGSIVHVSPNGLKYGYDPKYGNRVDHVLSHTTPNPNKKTHSVFTAQGDDALNLVDQAWARRGAPEPNDRKAFVVDMGRPVGTNGETRIRIIVDPATNEITTAYPY